ncbi:hypothetical protein V5O48_014794 [Marasmius crinis-equi]|uniref:CxC2-like cysteine cluster KDZ transposase-associated domain-containing protein n=1 Tax=Marasmius crinis-equi TaxID=585013 RepID=A0ABR3EWA7_9AGAR
MFHVLNNRGRSRGRGRGRNGKKLEIIDLVDHSTHKVDVVLPGTSRDGRRGIEHRVAVPPPVPEDKTSVQETPSVQTFSYSDSDLSATPLIEYLDSFATDDAFLFNSAWNNPTLDNVDKEEDAVEARETRQRIVVAQGSTRLMQEWRVLATSFLEEMLRLDGKSADENFCVACKKETTTLYRCRICSGDSLLCSECIVRGHVQRPLDIIEKWNGFFFERATLGSIGFGIQLGHPPGECCSSPRPARSNFVIVDVDSIQDVNVSYCMCRRSSVVGDSWQQLMRYRLYPGSVDTPATAFTFRCLTLFHNLTLQGKMTAYDFYHGLETLTDATGLTNVKDRYDSFVRVVRQWRFLKLLKRAGIGNVEEVDLDDLDPGSLAIRCPACPTPGVNMPDTLEGINPDERYLFRKFISVDACFRLKRRNVSSEEKDPGLFSGLAYFVPPGPYGEWVAMLPEQNDTSSCPGLAAMDQAETKYSKGYATTGVLFCLCSRHELVQPRGAGDLTKGEKHGCGDYVVMYSQQEGGSKLERVLVYDIACQWFKRFFQRILNLPNTVSFDTVRTLWQFAVPKLHIKTHTLYCQQNFSLHLMVGAGSTDGEGIERQWASLGPIGTSTKEMGPGHRRDTIDDHVSSWNWRKVSRLGERLKAKRRDAREQAAIQTEEYLDFSETQSTNVEGWRQRVIEWEGATESERAELSNPYAQVHKGLTIQEVRLQYAQQEEKDQKAGVVRLHDVSPSGYMVMALEVEEQQRQLSIDIKGTRYDSALQKTELLEMRGKLERLMARLRSIQRIYTPAAVTELIAGDLTNRRDPKTGEKIPLEIEEIPVLLPTGLSAESRLDPAVKGWVEMEVEFRKSQAASALEDLRSNLFVRARLNLQMHLHVRHQRGSGRARQVLARNERKVQASKLRYRAARDALVVALGGAEVEKLGLRVLNDSDVRSFEDDDTQANRSQRKVLGKRKRTDQETLPALIRPGETRKNLPWIWTGIDTGADSEAMLDSLRIEWSKSWARKRRWDEELRILQVEMDRTCVSLAVEGRRWKVRALAETGKGVWAEGRKAYAFRQAAIREGLVTKFRRLWGQADRPRKMLSHPSRTGQEEEEEEELIPVAEESGEED